MGGADIIIIYNSGDTDGWKRLSRWNDALRDANAIVVEMASEVLPVVKKTPVLAGVCGTDPLGLCLCSSNNSKKSIFRRQNFPRFLLMV